MKSEQNKDSFSDSKANQSSKSGMLGGKNEERVLEESVENQVSNSEHSINKSGMCLQLLEQNKLILEQIDLLSDKVENNNEKGLMIKRLLERNDFFQKDFLFKNIQQKMYRDLIRLYDRFDTMCENSEPNHKDAESSLIKFRSLQKELLQIMHRNGVEIEDVSGQFFDEDVCEIVDFKIVEDSESDMKIFKVVRPAFKYYDKLLRPASVIVEKYESKDKGDKNE